MSNESRQDAAAPLHADDFMMTLLRLAIAYVAAVAVAAGLGSLLRENHPLLVVLVADIAATCVIFCFSFAFRNSSFYDPYWSLAPIVIGIYFVSISVADQAILSRQLLAMMLVTLWGVRLTYNFLRGWQGIKHEDWRYTDLRASNGKAYWLVSLAGIHMFPTLLVFLACMPLYAALAHSTRPFGILDVVAALVTGIALCFEAAADQQLRRFVLSDHEPGTTLKTGLWAHSRHPNYFGEVFFWWGLYLFGLAADPSYWWTVVGALAITFLFIFISLPMIEKRHMQRRPDYPDYKKTTSILVPWFRK